MENNLSSGIPFGPVITSWTRKIKKMHNINNLTIVICASTLIILKFKTSKIISIDDKNVFLIF